MAKSKSKQGLHRPLVGPTTRSHSIHKNKRDATDDEERDEVTEIANTTPHKASLNDVILNALGGELGGESKEQQLDDCEMTPVGVIGDGRPATTPLLHTSPWRSLFDKSGPTTKGFTLSFVSPDIRDGHCVPKVDIEEVQQQPTSTSALT